MDSERFFLVRRLLGLASASGIILKVIAILVLLSGLINGVQIAQAECNNGGYGTDTSFTYSEGSGCLNGVFTYESISIDPTSIQLNPSDVGGGVPYTVTISISASGSLTLGDLGVYAMHVGGHDFEGEGARECGWAELSNELHPNDIPDPQLIDGKNFYHISITESADSYCVPGQLKFGVVPSISRAFSGFPIPGKTLQGNTLNVIGIPKPSPAAVPNSKSIAKPKKVTKPNSAPQPKPVVHKSSASSIKNKKQSPCSYAINFKLVQISTVIQAWNDAIQTDQQIIENDMYMISNDQQMGQNLQAQEAQQEMFYYQQQIGTDQKNINNDEALYDSLTKSCTTTIQRP